MSPSDQQVLDGIVAASPLAAKYAEPLDRDSAHEMLARKLEAGAAVKEKAEAETPQAEHVPYPKKSAPKTAPRQEEGGMVHDILTSPVAKDFARTAAREIFRGVFGTARRR